VEFCEEASAREGRWNKL